MMLFLNVCVGINVNESGKLWLVYSLVILFVVCSSCVMVMLCLVKGVKCVVILGKGSVLMFLIWNLVGVRCVVSRFFSVGFGCCIFIWIFCWGGWDVLILGSVLIGLFWLGLFCV